MPEATTKTRAKKETMPLVIGKWLNGVFTQEAKQPAEPLTETLKMLAWARLNYSANDGEYEFVRRVPGKLIIKSVTATSVTFE